MNEVVRVWIGSDERGGRGEIVLKHGITKYASGPVEVINMRPGGEYRGIKYWEEGAWNRGRNHPMPYSGQGWATNFTCFRFGIPEYCGFEGRAIYMDADQTVHGDVHELMNFPLSGKPASMRKGVMVFDCGHRFWRSDHWLSLHNMRTIHHGLGDLHRRVNEGGGFATFPVEWDVLDGKEIHPRDAKLLHYTAMQNQPYHPFPDRFSYPLRHPHPECDSVWWESYGDSLATMANIPFQGFSRFRNKLKWAVELEASLGLDRFGRLRGFKYWFTEPVEFERRAGVLNPNGFRGSPNDLKNLMGLL